MFVFSAWHLICVCSDFLITFYSCDLARYFFFLLVRLDQRKQKIMKKNNSGIVIGWTLNMASNLCLFKLSCCILFLRSVTFLFSLVRLDQRKQILMKNSLAKLLFVLSAWNVIYVHSNFLVTFSLLGSGEVLCFSIHCWNVSKGRQEG